MKDWVINKFLSVAPPRYILWLAMTLLDGQTVSGYGMSVTFKFPPEKRAEILSSIGVKDD